MYADWMEQGVHIVSSNNRCPLLPPRRLHRDRVVHEHIQTRASAPAVVCARALFLRARLHRAPSPRAYTGPHQRARVVRARAHTLASAGAGRAGSCPSGPQERFHAAHEMARRRGRTWTYEVTVGGPAPIISAIQVGGHARAPPRLGS